MARNHEFHDAPSRHAPLVVLLSIASFVLVITTVFMIQTLSVAYGEATVTTALGTTNAKGLTSTLIQAAVGEHTLYTTILAGYIGLLAALGMLISAALLYKYNSIMLSSEAKGHTNLHSALTVLYALLFTLYINSIDIALPMYYLGIVYAALLVCVGIDLYSIVFLRYMLPRKFAVERSTTLAIDPAMPYTNLMKMKDDLFSQLKGPVSVVDKHMNSIGMENLHRLIHERLGQIPEINVITSKDMLDGEFTRNYADWKSEMGKAGVKLKVMIMNDDESVEQHERFMFDGRGAYKVPPFNVINKKSEHITKIDLHEARRRFEQLRAHSMTYENFIVKMGQVQTQ